MPWTPGDAPRYDKDADTPKRCRKWAAIANAILSRNGDEVMAIKTANARTESLFEGLKRIERQIKATERLPASSTPQERLATLKAKRVFRQAIGQSRTSLGSPGDVVNARFARAKAEIATDKPARVRSSDEMDTARARGLRFIEALKKKKVAAESDLSESWGAKRFSRVIGAKLKKANIDLPTPEVVPLGHAQQGQLAGVEEPLERLKDPQLSTRVMIHRQLRSRPYGIPAGHVTQPTMDQLAQAQRKRYHDTLASRRALVTHAMNIAKQRAASLGPSASQRLSLIGKAPDDTHVIEPPQPQDEPARPLTRRLPRQTDKV
jgi:uncharacterized protein YdaT